MTRAARCLSLACLLCLATPSWAAPQDPQFERGPAQPVQRVGSTVAAALANVVYAPVRMAATIVFAEVGGLMGFMTGGNRESAQAVWNATEGQAFITPAMIQGREQLRFGNPERY